MGMLMRSVLSKAMASGKSLARGSPSSALAAANAACASRGWSQQLQQVRHLNVHEYVALEVMEKHNVGVPAYKMVDDVKDIGSAFSLISNGPGGGKVVVKAQVLSGGRGLGTFKSGLKGGVHICNSTEEATSFAGKMLGQQLVTKQTGADGLPCDKVLLMECVDIKREMYLSIMMDRASQGPVIVACADGGTSIEDLAESNPELILKEKVDINVGLTQAQAEKIAEHLQMQPGTDAFKSGTTLLSNMFDMFLKTDCTLLEINPLAELTDGRVLACDGKLNFDDNAEWRQKDIFQHRDFSQEDSREVEAAKYDLNYIGLTGNIGCMVNGAGLAMSTMDLIKLKGGDPANFLDVGGGATEAQVEKALELLDADPNVKTILVNIFGGIMRCDVIASGVLKAAESIGTDKPIVIRLQGTNVEKAHDLLNASDFKMTVCDDLETAAEKAVQMAG